MVETKKIIIGITIFAAILIALSAVFYFLSISKGSIGEEGENLEGAVQGPKISFFAEVKKVDLNEKYLLVEPVNYPGKEVMLAVDGQTDLIKMESPFDSKNPPKTKKVVNLEQKNIELSGFQKEDIVFVKAYGDIAKNEIEKVDFIKIEP